MKTKKTKKKEKKRHEQHSETWDAFVHLSKNYCEQENILLVKESELYCDRV